jgi:hypothetical protein
MLGLRAALSLCILAALGGCRGRSAPSDDAAPEGGAPAKVASAGEARPRALKPRSPLSQAELPTTSGAIAMVNLNAQIDGLSRRLDADPKSALIREELIGVLSTRAQLTGRIADYERALSLSEEMVKEAPERAQGYLARAGARAALHLFEGALQDVAEAEKRKARPDHVRSQRASILQGLGRYDEALTLRRAASEARPTLVSLGSEAALLGEMGKLDEAERLFVEAQRHFRDVSPFPIAWLYFEQGSMWERAASPEGASRARELFAAAVERLPAHAHAAAHLAAMSPYAQGIELLRPIAAQADDPEYAAALSVILRRKGDAAEADALLTAAKARYDALTAAHPEAFADHAARFWLNAGGDRQKALALAKKNVEVRKTEAAYDLLLVTALAASSKEEACAAAREGAKLLYASELFRRTAADVTKTCP